MLIAMKSKVAKWVLIVLMSLVGGALVISLGFGDLFRGTSREVPVITVGDAEIYRNEVNQEFSRLVDQFSQAFGSQLDADQARAMGLMDTAVRNIVTRTLFLQFVRDLGLGASDQQAMARLASEPGMVDVDGHIDRVRLLEFMRSAGYTEERLISELKSEIMRNQLYAPIAAGATAPGTLVDIIFLYRNERRVANAVFIDAGAMPMPADPDEATLRAYHEANAEQYMAPEYRSIDYAWFTPETFEDQILVDDGTLREEYEARKAEFDQPELRSVEQILFQDEQSARTAIERIDAGEDFAAVAEDMTGAPPIDMGQMEATGLVSDLSVLVDTAFATPVGEAAGPVETALGWHVIRVKSVTPAHSPTFEEVRDLLSDEVKQAIAVDRMIETANLIDDRLAAGDGLADAAATAGIEVHTVGAIDAQGLGPEGTMVVENDPGHFVAGLAFRTEPGEISLLTENPDVTGYAIVAVNGAAPPEPRPFEQVRDQVLEAWRGDERLRMAQERADTIVAEIDAGRSLAEVAAEQDLQVATTKPMTRSEGDSIAHFPSTLTGTLFERDPGGAVSGPVGNGYVVAVLTEIQPADPMGDADSYAKLQVRVETEIATDLLNSFADALRQHYSVDVDRAALDKEF